MLRRGCGLFPSLPAAAASAAACARSSASRARALRTGRCPAGRPGGGRAGTRAGGAAGLPVRDHGLLLPRRASSSRTCAAARATAAGAGPPRSGRQRLQVRLPLLAGRRLRGLPLASPAPAGRPAPARPATADPALAPIRAQQQVGAGQRGPVRLVGGGGLRASAMTCAASLRSPASVRLASFDAFAAILTPSRPPRPAAPAPRTRTRAGPGKTAPPPARPARTGASGTGRTSCDRGSPGRTRPGTSRRSGTGPPPPGWTAPRAVGVHPHGQQHHRVIPRRAGRDPFGAAAPAGRPGPRHQPLHRADNDPDSMPLRHPVEHIRGQKHSASRSTGLNWRAINQFCQQ